MSRFSLVDVAAQYEVWYLSISRQYGEAILYYICVFIRL